MATRKCPYCAEEISTEALVCRHCHRDFYLQKALLARIDELSERVVSLEQALSEAAPADNSESGAVAPATGERAPPRRARAWAAPVVLVILLSLLHALLVLVLDARLIHLRLLSILLPLAAGFAFRRALEQRWLVDVETAVVVAAAAVLAMAASVAMADQVAWLPRDRTEWIEALQYAASIALGFLSGSLARYVLILATQPADAPDGLLKGLIRSVGAELLAADNNASFEKRLKKLEGIMTTLMAIFAAIVSAVLGLGKLFG